MLQLIPPNTKFDFMRIHKMMFAISMAAVIGTYILLFTVGMNMGTDFAGGVLMEVKTSKAQDLGKLRTDLNALNLGNINLTTIGDDDQIMIRMGQQKDAGGEQAAINKVKNEIGADAEYRRIEYVGPQVGKELIKKGIWAIVLSTLGVLVYVMFRFQWQFGLSSVVAFLHDTFLTIGLFCVTRAEFDLTTLAAVLMIGGYSINDTVVVFDRVREMMQKYQRMPLIELFNLSVNATLSRTILTGGTSILALIALWVLGGDVIQGFVTALIWGILVGTYSSVFIATPLLLYLGMKDENRQSIAAASKTV